MWVPDIGRSGLPSYLAIVDAIGDAICTGRLRPGDVLPTHRLLADLLGLNVSTVTRAYREAGKRRLVGGEVGRGTYVLGVASEAALFALAHRPEGGVIDLSLNIPPVAMRDLDLGEAFSRLGPGEAARLLHYPSPHDTLVHRREASAWLRRRGVEPDPGCMAICAGAQHAMTTAIGLFPEYHEIACEALVYPGLKAAARQLERRLHAMPMDAEGVRPDGLEAACRAGLRLAVVSPTLHNPTTATMGLERRQRLVAIARKHDAILVEEDVYGLLPEGGPPPLAALAPERVVYLTGLSKTLAPALRIGYLVLPPALAGRLREAEPHTTWYVSALTLALATRWFQDGTAWRRLLHQRRELAARFRICQKQLGHAWRGEEHCPHVWLTAPPGGSADFTRRAQAAGVVVVPAAVFAVGRPASDGVRISIGSAASRATLAEGLGRLTALG
jgi:DNA-binding transcriptional MocR family regulator